MSMNKTVAKRIGFLATGSEVTSGEIVNLDSKMMAARLLDHGMDVGEHLCCDDHKKNIHDCLEILLERHDAIITSGGLGPTSDDCTMQIISEVAGKKLKFDDATWTRIVERLSKRKAPITDNNKQQAYFPEGAQILINKNGSASGCFININGVLVFVLPGPPRECIPMFEEQVLPILIKENFATSKRLFRWRLIGVSESKIAEMLEPIAERYHFEFAYRAHYPYTDIKIFLDPQTKQHTKILLEVEAVVRPYFVTHLNQNMSQQLKEHLLHHPIKIYLDDPVTKGAFKQSLLCPATLPLFVDKMTKADLEIYFHGFDEYWQNQTEGMMELKLELRQGNKHLSFTSPVLIRGQESIFYALEFAAWKILNCI